MKRLVLCSCVFLLAVQTAAPCVQAQRLGHGALPPRPAPQFALSISEYRHDGRGSGKHRLRIVITNVSSEPLHLDGCATLRGLYGVAIVYNGVPMEEQNPAARRLGEAKMKQTPCATGAPSDIISPGGSNEDILSLTGPFAYEMSQPGTYEITVSRETDTGHPDKSVSVKSNTLTIVVPEPEAAEPK
jgi:hypothetical protein